MISIVVSVILFLLAVIQGLAILINKKDSERNNTLINCMFLEHRELIRKNTKEHEELFDAKNELAKDVFGILKMHKLKGCDTPEVKPKGGE